MDFEALSAKFFSFYSVLIISVFFIIPLAIITYKLSARILTEVPLKRLRSPVMVIIVSPLMLQLLNIVELLIPVKTGLTAISLSLSKLLIPLVFYNFYLLLREVVYFEYLLKGEGDLNDQPEFSDTNSVESS